MSLEFSPSLGTELRRLIDLLDSDVEKCYMSLGLRYRPRFTPVVKALEALGPSSIKVISRHSNLSHSAASQTVAHMTKEGLLTMREGADGREADRRTDCSSCRNDPGSPFAMASYTSGG